MSERFVSPLVASVPPSGIRRFFDVAGTMKDAISLGVGEPDFVTPFHIRNAAIDSLLDGQTQYTPNMGLPELRQEIAYYIGSRFQVQYDPAKEILATVGASEAIDIALRACLRPGDEVIVPDPGYVSYSPCVIFSGGTPIAVRTYAKDEFRLTAENMEKAITRKTRALIFPYPNNPTGATMTKDEIEKIALVAKKYDLLVISDEIYCELLYDGQKHYAFSSLPGMRERTILINGFSKAFAMTGWRMGYACAPREIIEQMNKIHQYTIMCATRQSQVAAAEALKKGRENNYADIENMLKSYDRRRLLMLDAFEKMGLECFRPKGAFYCFPSIEKTGLTSEEFCTRLLHEQKVVCVPGTAFGESGEGHIRCCYATDVQLLVEAFKRMQAFLNSIK